MGIVSAIYNNNNNNKAKHGSSLKEQYAVLGALKNESDIKMRNTEI